MKAPALKRAKSKGEEGTMISKMCREHAAKKGVTL